MNTRLWIVLGVLIIGTVGGLIWWKNSQPEYMDANKLITKQDIINAKEAENPGMEIDETTIIPDHFTGNKDSKVVVIEYEDFACSHCQAFQVYTSKIHDDYKDKVLFIHRNYSLGYPNSEVTIAAAEAAYLLGGEEAFWKMADLLFQDTKWVGQAVADDETQEVLDSYAEEIGLDVDKFNETRNNLADNGIKDKMQRDKSLGSRSGVSGTPTWMINGEKIDNSTDSSIRKAIDEAIDKNQ